MQDPGRYEMEKLLLIDDNSVSGIMTPGSVQQYRLFSKNVHDLALPHHPLATTITIIGILYLSKLSY